MKAGQGLEIDRDKYGIGQGEQNISFLSNELRK